MTNEQIEEMADRFLFWRLPDDFSPDGGVKFTPPSDAYPHMENAEQLWPVGTNILNKTQAIMMVKHMLGVDG